ncbi:MAG: hypothetical protein KJO53_01395 [Eudoraea sp.]|nr:hypothetical protein [Eudoraea sp.]MBT8300252.1 hypothetical protein [Maribacter sp.]
MKNNGLESISKQELLNINGGHKGLAYKLGVIAASNVLTVLGIFAGISSGFDEGVKEE